MAENKKQSQASYSTCAAYLKQTFCEVEETGTDCIEGHCCSQAFLYATSFLKMNP